MFGSQRVVKLCLILFQRLDVLIKSNKFADALALSGRFYDGKARAVVGLYGGIHKRRRVVSEKVRETRNV